MLDKHKHFTSWSLQFSLVKLLKHGLDKFIFCSQTPDDISAFEQCCNTDMARTVHGLSTGAAVGAQKLNFWCPILHTAEAIMQRQNPWATQVAQKSISFKKNQLHHPKGSLLEIHNYYWNCWGFFIQMTILCCEQILAVNM